MHIFLQGQRNVGKSTVIQKTLEIITVRTKLVPGGFFTWNSGGPDPEIHIRAAGPDDEKETYRAAVFDKGKGGMVCDNNVFESEGARFVREGKNADLIIMDELGYLESNAPVFIKAVMDAIAGNIPILGVMRLGDVPWHEDIKKNKSVRLIDVNMENRNVLPQEIAGMIELRIEN